MRGRIRTRSLASSSPNEKRAPGALFGNAILYVETPAGGIKPVSGAPDVDHTPARGLIGDVAAHASAVGRGYRSEEHTSELQSLLRISYAVFCVKKQKKCNTNITI